MRLEAEPRDGLLALLALGRVSRRVGLAVLGAARLADLVLSRVEVEEGRRVVGEEVLAGYDQVRGAHARVLLRREVELESQFGQEIQQIRVRGGDAARVEECSYGTGGDGDGGRVGCVAGVVLRSAADGHVL